MATLMAPSRERQQAMYRPVWVYNYSDETYIDKFNGEYFKIGPKQKMLLPAQVVWNWVGDPDLRKDAKLWYKELNRLKSRRGEGTAHFDKWLIGRKLIVPELGNNEEGYYGLPSEKAEKVNENSVAISAEELDRPLSLPALTPLTNISDEEVLNFFEGMVSTAPKGEVGGIGGSESSDLTKASTISSGPINIGKV
jgi:hypothetical protein